MSDDIWGPWIEHDGKGCPCKGMWVQLERINGQVVEGLAGMSVCNGRTGERVGPAQGGLPSAWNWDEMAGYHRQFRVVRYRIRKPRALQQLREMIETLPAPSRQKEDA